MADPLSIASGIAGLIALTTKIVSELANLAENVRNGPQIVATVVKEVQELRNILEQVQGIIEQRDMNKMNESRLSMIPLKDLVVTITACICSFSEMERISASPPPEDTRKSFSGSTSIRLSHPLTMEFTYRSRLEIGFNIKTYNKFLDELNTHKRSLSLMLMVLNCETSSQALVGVNQLNATVYQILESQKKLQEILLRRGGDVGVTDIPNNDVASIKSAAGRTIASVARSFEQVLRSTGVYRRGYVWNSSRFSIESPAMKHSHWSALSDLSLSEVSNIGVMELPLSVDDVFNPSTYKNATLAYLGAALLTAASNGNDEEVQTLLDKGADISYHDEKGLTPLHRAVRGNFLNTATLLLERGADPNLRTPNLNEPILHTIIARTAQPELTRLLLTHGANVDARNVRGETALMWAAGQGSDDMIELLIEHGANVNATSRRDDYTPLHFAAQKGHVSTVALLLKHGADPAYRAYFQLRGRELEWISVVDAARNGGHDEVIDIIEHHLQSHKSSGKPSPSPPEVDKE